MERESISKFDRDTIEGVQKGGSMLEGGKGRRRRHPSGGGGTKQAALGPNPSYPESNFESFETCPRMK